MLQTQLAFRAYHNEDGTVDQLAYDAGIDLAQGTGFQI